MCWADVDDNFRFAQMANFDYFRKSKNSWISLLYIWNNEALHQSGLAIFCESPCSFPNLKTCPCALRAPTCTFVTWLHFFELLRPKFCFARSHTAPPCQNKKTVGLQVHSFRFQIFKFLLSTFFVRRGFWTSWSCCNWARGDTSISFRDGIFLLR